MDTLSQAKTMADPRIDQMQTVITAMQQSMQEATTEMVRMNGVIQGNAAAIANLTKIANTAWGKQARRIDDLETELQKEVDELQAGLRRSGGGGGQQGDAGDRWNLEHKGALKDYAGDKKAYKSRARKVMAFCNSK